MLERRQKILLQIEDRTTCKQHNRIYFPMQNIECVEIIGVKAL